MNLQYLMQYGQIIIYTACNFVKNYIRASKTNKE